MFGKKAKRIKELEVSIGNLRHEVFSLRNYGTKVQLENLTGQLSVSQKELQDLGYRYQLLESLMKNLRINVTLPKRS